ncbi:response regulator [Flavobacterium sp. AG291]|uniref:response regulator n=1 Tax=Flavobacterium sp. AG291 TaxID=2184000 RepID=UPI000E0B38B3|nr:response regulator [Flavobacterium sp. AG291]
MYSKSIILVEDDSDDRELFCLIVHEMPSAIECIEFSNGKDAFDYLKTTDKLPDIIFTDLDMHLMSGEEFIIELKKEGRTKDIPVYIYTTPFMFGHTSDIIKSSVTGCVFKNSDFNDFENGLKTVLQEHYGSSKEPS